MPTPSERKALLFVAAVALLGAAVRAQRTLSGAPRANAQSRQLLASHIAAVEAAGRSGARGRGAAARPQVVDVNSASVAQLQALPRVGPVLAQRIKAYRDSAGPFASLEALDSVKGIGPAMLRELAARVTFSPSRRPRDAPSSG